jgi:hypothetical protein
MHDEVFRLALAIGFVVTLPVGLYYRVQSQRTRELPHYSQLVYRIGRSSGGGSACHPYDH